MVEELIKSGIANLLNIELDSKLAESLSFFIYDSIKIIIFLFIMIAIMGYLRTYISQKKIKSLLSKRLGLSNFFASMFVL